MIGMEIQGGHALPPLSFPEQLQEHEYKEQQSIVFTACIYTALAGRKDAQCAVVVKKQQKHQYKEEQCTVVCFAAMFNI